LLIPAHELRLDQSRLQSALGASTGGDFSPRTSANDDHAIIARHGFVQGVAIT
jgi:hypothetical protein